MASHHNKNSCSIQLETSYIQNGPKVIEIDVFRLGSFCWLQSLGKRPSHTNIYIRAPTHTLMTVFKAIYYDYIIYIHTHTLL